MPSSSTSTSVAEVRATPAVRRLAQQRGVVLAGVTGTGIGGRITTGDVRAAAPARPPAPDDSWFPAYRGTEASPRVPARVPQLPAPQRTQTADWFPGAPTAAELRAASPDARPTITHGG